MSQITYRLATNEDIETLSRLRAAFLAEVSGPEAAEPTFMGTLRQYFTETLSTGEFMGYLAEADGMAVATSGMVIHRHPPRPANPGGCEAYIMNMYTLPTWRGRGIATALLKMLIALARQKLCLRVTLHAMPMGRSIYARAGFKPVDTEMRLDLRTLKT